MIPTLLDPTSLQEVQHDDEKKEAFILAYKDSSEQLNLVQQYYEIKWSEPTFGIDEHTWLHYVGAYKNLTWEEGDPKPIASLNALVGKTKLAGTQVMDANHILNLIGSKVVCIKYFADHNHKYHDGYLLTYDTINKVVILEKTHILFDSVIEVN